MRLKNKLEDVRKAVGKCIKCTVCTYSGWPDNYAVCPMYAYDKCFTYSGGGLMYLAKNLIDHKLIFDSKVSDLLFTCPGCLACDDICEIIPYSEPYVSHFDIVRLMRREAVERGLVKDEKLKRIQAQIQSYEKAILNKKDNVLGIQEKIFDKNSKRFLFVDWQYVTSQPKAFRSVLNLLERIGEPMDGLSDRGFSFPELYDLGFWSELEKYLTKKFDIKLLRGKELIFINPHLEEFIKYRVPEMIPGYDNIKTRHISEVLLEALRKGKLRSKKGLKRIKVSFHDPCYLGRGLKIYEPPRDVLAFMDNIELIEMGRNRKDSFCCGARAGGNYFQDFSKNTALERLKEFRMTGADLLITACPYCKGIFQKMTFGKRNIVKDITEFIEERIE